MKVKSEAAQACLSLCDLMDCSLPGSSVHGIFQARVLVWSAVSFSRRSSWPRDWTRVSHVVSSVQLLSCVWLFATPGTTAHQASLSITNCWSLPKPMSIDQWCHPTISSSVVPISSRLQSFPASGSFPMSQLFASGGQSIEVSASTSVLPMNTQDWSPLGWTGWISLQSKGLLRVFSNTTVQKHQFFGVLHCRQTLYCLSHQGSPQCLSLP